MRLFKLFEGISPVVFHYTSPHNAHRIISEDRFKLTSAFGTDAERMVSDDETLYYLSTTRHLLGGYHLVSGLSGVMLNLDGRKLSNRYSGKPIDYWGLDFRRIEPTKAEAEDRIYHTEPVIENATDYIDEIHVYARLDRIDENQQRMLRHLFIEVKKNNITHFFYDSYEDWLLQNKRKSIDIPVFRTQPKAPGWYRKRRPFSGYMELFKKGDVDDLSREGKRVYRYIYNKRDFNSQLKADIHNNKSRVEESGLERLLDLFRKNGLSTVQEVHDFLYNKWIDR